MRVRLYITTLHIILMPSHHIGLPSYYDRVAFSRNRDSCGCLSVKVCMQTVKYYVKFVRIYTKLKCCRTIKNKYE